MSAGWKVAGSRVFEFLPMFSLRALGPGGAWWAERMGGHSQEGPAGDVLCCSMRSGEVAIPALARAAGGLAPGKDLFGLPADALAGDVGVGTDAHAHVLPAGIRRRMTHDPNSRLRSTNRQVWHVVANPSARCVCGSVQSGSERKLAFNSESESDWLLLCWSSVQCAV